MLLRVASDGANGVVVAAIDDRHVGAFGSDGVDAGRRDTLGHVDAGSAPEFARRPRDRPPVIALACARQRIAGRDVTPRA